MDSIEKNLQSIEAQIADICGKYGREKEEVKLLCVSKTKPIEAIIEAYKLGYRHFGENYAQEAFTKIESLQEMGYKDIIWHFIGPIQGNKTKLIVNSCDLVESVDRKKIAHRLNEQREESKGPLDILVQVNISAEEQKSGVLLAELDDLITYIQSLTRLRLRGLMGIAKDTSDKELILKQFMELKHKFSNYQATIKNFDILSLGMTHDMEQAIACGSTEVRIGTAIFGARNYGRN